MYSRLYHSIVPNICCLCDDIGQTDLDLCASCHSDLPNNPSCCYQCAIPIPSSRSAGAHACLCGRCLTSSSAVDRAIVPFLYRPPIDYMIKRLKFSERMQFSRITGELLANSIAQLSETADAIVPVPIHQQRLVMRGYNQAELIARTLAKRLQIPVLKSAVIRTEHKLSQSTLSAREREINIKRAFSVGGNDPVQGLEIAVVDDVYTTGATARAIATHLKKAGATKVSIWAVARTP